MAIKIRATAQAIGLECRPLEYAGALYYGNDDHHGHHQEDNFPVDVG
jgi:hypothetical protein